MLHLCIATATSAAIEIRPSCPPIDRILSFVRARRRGYLTATLADDSALVTDFGANPQLIAKPVTPGSAADLVPHRATFALFTISRSRSSAACLFRQMM